MVRLHLFTFKMNIIAFYCNNKFIVCCLKFSQIFVLKTR